MSLDALEVLVLTCILFRARSEVRNSVCQLPGCQCSELPSIPGLSTPSPDSLTRRWLKLDCRWMSVSKSKLQLSNMSVSIVNVQCDDLGDPGVLLDSIRQQTTHLLVLKIDDCMTSREFVSQVEMFTSLTTLSLENVTLGARKTGDGLSPLSNTSGDETSGNTTARISVCSLKHLKRLIITDVSNINFDRCQVPLISLVRVDLRNNGFASVPEFLSMATHSQELTLQDNNISNVSNNVFNNLTELVSLDLSSNKLTSLPEGLFSGQMLLQNLNLSNNQIKSLPAKLLSHNHNLTNIDLSHNRIKFLSGQLFSNLHLLTILNLSHNSISFVVRSQFAHLQNLQHLNMGYNNLRRVPSLASCRKLQLLDFRHNVVKYTSPSDFKGLRKLEGIGMKHNKLERLVLQHLAVSQNMQVLDFSENQITQLVYSSEVVVHRGNVVNTSLSLLRSVTYLILQSNLLTDITRLGETFTGLQFLNLNDNRISSLFRKDLPRSLKLVSLAYNRMTSIEYRIFTHFPNLTYINLSFNYPHLSSMPAMVAMTYRKSFPKLYMSGNLFTCDCRMAYLKTYADRNYSRSFRYYAESLPEFADLSDVVCITETDSSLRKLVQVNEEEFLCDYKGVVCELVCGCCSKDVNSSCECAQQCPEPCQCYQGGSEWGVYDFRVLCNTSPGIGFPSPIPPSTTYLYLDNNTVSEVSDTDLTGLENLRYLFLNSTGLSNISAGSFADLGSLKALHLDHNKLSGFVSGTWRGLSRLVRLYLQSNLVQVLQPGVFLDLPGLRYLDLSDNLLTRLSADFFSLPSSSPPPLFSSSSLCTILVDKNPLSCSCTDMLHTSLFLAVFGHCLAHLESLYCTAQGNSSLAQNDTLTEEIYLKYFDIGICYKNTTVVKETRIQSYLFIKDNRYVWALSVISLLLVAVTVAAIVAFRKRQTLQAWMFVKFGVRVRSPNAGLDDTGRTYDAFVSYSSLDERLVVRELAPRLEDTNKQGRRKYKLCLHYRDFPVGESIADTIMESIEASKRTILLLSDNFLDSEWCRFEFQTAHHHVLKERSHRLIIVLLHDIHDTKLDPDMRVHLKAGRFLKYSDPWFWEKLYFALPDVPRVTVERDENTELEEL